MRSFVHVSWRYDCSVDDLKINSICQLMTLEGDILVGNLPGADYQVDILTTFY